jgi:hypothetical protein
MGIMAANKACRRLRGKLDHFRSEISDGRLREEAVE